MEQRTILFVDQVGSTRQLAEIGDVAMVEVRQRLWRLVRDAIEPVGGRIFSDEGDGGAIVFADALAGADAALAVIAGARRENIALRAGLHSGPVVANGDGFVGLAVHTAARLCEAAPSGHVLTTDSDVTVSHSDRTRFTEFGQRTLKGFAEPIAVLLVTDAALDAPPIDDLLRSPELAPLPSSSLLHAGIDMFVGRRVEVEHLGSFPDALASARSGVATLLIDGNPGAGKSTLAHRRCRELVESGVLCLVGRADEGLDDPLHEMIQPLEHLIRHAPVELLADHVLRHGELLTRWIPGLGDRVPSASRRHSDGEQAPDRRAVFDAVADLLDAASRLQPIVLLIEDIHWATGPTLDVMRRLVLGPPLPGVSIVATYRSTEVHGDGVLAQFLGKVGPQDNVATQHIEPMPVDDIELLVAAQLPAIGLDRADLTEAIAAHLRRTTGGNALFCVEVLRHADVDAVLAAGVDDLAAVFTVPDTVQDLARHRVDQLGAQVVDVLADASILGESFATRDLLHMVGDRADALGALDRSERAALVRADDAGGRRFRFGHALVQEALTAQMTTADRLQRHRRAADAVSAGSGEVSRAAEHLRHLQGAGVLAMTDEVVVAAGRAADDAAERLALPAAAAFRQLAVDALAVDPDASALALAHGWFALALAQTAVSSGTGGPFMVSAANCARRAGDWALFAEIAVSYGGALKENQAADDVSEPVGLVSEALLHHVDPTPMRARLLICLALWRRQSTVYDERRAWVDEATAIVEAAGDDRTTAVVLAEWHRALHGPRAAAEAGRIADRLDELALVLGDATIELQAINLRLTVAIETGDIAAESAAATRLTDVAMQGRGFEAERLRLMWQVTQNFVRGEFEAAQTAIGRLGVHMADYPADVLDRFNSALVFPTLWLQGHQDMIYAMTSDRSSIPASRAWFAAEIGRTDEAADHLARVGGPAGIVDRNDYLWWHDVVGCTRALRYLGDREFAAELYAAVLPYRHHNAVMGLVSYLGCAEHHLGSLAEILGRLDDAVEHFDAALAHYAALGAVPLTALAEAELVQTLERRGNTGDVDRAAVLRRSAAEVADDLGLGSVTGELARDVRGVR